jgi:DNA-binding transcriptional ArsR family regulator
MPRRIVPEPDPLWHALADPTRRRILDLLRDGPQTTGALAAHFPTSRFTVMEHLATLVRAHLVTVERRGRERLNHLNAVPLEQAYRHWVHPVAGGAAESVLALSSFAESRRSADAMTVQYGIDVRAEHLVQAPVHTTWEALLDLPVWWRRCWDGRQSLRFEPRVGGRLVLTPDDDPDGGAGQLWGAVRELRPLERLAVEGSMGIPGPVLGLWQLLLTTEDPATTTVTLEHRVLGEVADDARSGFEAGWTTTLTALAAHAEHLRAASRTTVAPHV